MIPVDVFVSDATGLIETHHYDVRQYNLPACWRYPRKKDAHFAIMGKANNQLVNDPILPDSARQRLDLHVVGPMANEMIAIKALDLYSAGTTS